MIYYIFVFIISFLYKVKNDKTPNNSFLRVRWILAYIKYKYKIKKILTIYLITSIVLTSAFVFVNPRKLEINIVDQTTLNMIQDISSIIARKPMIIGEI